MAIVFFPLRVRSSIYSEYRYNHGRFGVSVTYTGGHPSQYDVGMLNIGWYWDFTARNIPALESLEYIQTIRLSPADNLGYTANPTGTALLDIIAANAGAWWLIGNEPDCVWQDNMPSYLYAKAYHDLYLLIKGADPTAKIGAGSIVQPTPQRLRYLDKVLEAYEQMYGEPLPVDAWVTHNYILCENCIPQRPGDPFAWGACPVPDWPEGSEDATYYSVYDHWRLDIFRERLINFRRWMRDRGYRNYPLFVSEYGILFYDGLVEGKTIEDNIAFMYGTFDWMLEARDPELGYPPDDNRLVQRWAWFSLDHDWWYMGGALFDYITHQPLDMGIAYSKYTSALTPTLKLLIKAWAKPAYGPSGEPITATLYALISNAGDVKSPGPLKVTFMDKSGMTIKELKLKPLNCCGDWVEVNVDWPGLTDGAHHFCASVVTPSAEEVWACGVAMVNPHSIYLPLVMRQKKSF